MDQVIQPVRRGLAAQSIANLGSAAPKPYLSILDNRFTLIDAAGNEAPIPTYEGDPGKCLRGQAVGSYADVLICDVNTHVSRIFYDEPFDPNANAYPPPACFSHNGVGPSTQAGKPQSPTCAACPNSAWGSATSKVSGKGIPACSQYQFLAVLVVGHDAPFLLRVPPNSLKNYRAYANLFVGKTFDLNNIITRLSFESQGTLAFTPVGQAPPAMSALDARIYEGGTTAAIIGKLDAPISNLLPAPAHGQPTQLAPPPLTHTPTPLQLQNQAPATFAPPAQPTAPAPAKRGRGRPANSSAQQANGGVPPQQAPFPHPQQAQLQPGAPAQPAQPAPPPPNLGGMAPGAPPTDDMSKMLDDMFGPAQ